MDTSTVSDPFAGCSNSGSDPVTVASSSKSNTDDTESGILNDSGEIYQSVYDVFEAGPTQHYTIADNVIIEHIELAEGECAETEEHIDLVEGDCDESEEQPSMEDSHISVIHKWTTGEKRKFLEAIKLYGMHDNVQIASHVPSRTVEEVTEATEYFRIEARKRIAKANEYKMNSRGRRASAQGSPLMHWIQKLNDNFSPEELETVTGDALRLIAECEHFPPPADTTNVDFKQIYHALASAVDGRPLPDLSNESMEVLRRAITEVSLSANHIKSSGFEHHIQSLTSLRASHLNPVKDADKECPLRYRLAHLISNKQYNPLNVPTELLDPYKTSGTISNKNIFE